MGKEDGPV